MYHFHEISHAFQYTAIEMIIFCACENLCSNKKSLKGYQNHCVKWLQTIFGGGKPFSKLTLKTKWYHSCCYCDNSRSCWQLKKRVTGKYFEKSWILNPNHLPLQDKYVTITIVEWLVSTWCVYFTKIPNLRLSDQI